ELFTAKALSHIASWIGKELYPMWNDINKLIMYKITMNKDAYAQSVDYLKDTYELPDAFLNTLHFIKPTERQLHILKGRLERNPEENKQYLEKIQHTLMRYQSKKEGVKKRIEHLSEQLKSEQGDLQSFIDLLSWMQAGQLFDDPELNQGYNIPGTPGTAITYHYDKNDRFNINIGWVLSTKGLAELWLGTILKRKERRDR
ncbi:MAG TPA: hypothetical protein PLS49_08305, partial [Candidatus Woesebacteria bacterium]|nr:hypothetical protein [Candidatus Woesebacteria bacterium]